MRLLSVLSLSLVLMVSGCGGPDPVDAPSVGFEIGNRAPVLEGLDVEAQPTRIVPGSGAPQVIVFYSSASCGLCQVQLERMQENRPAYERENAALIAVSMEAPDESRSFRERVGISYPVISVDSATFNAWVPMDSVLGTPLPATYILDGSGLVVFRHIGRNSSDRTADAGLIAILSELNAP